VRPSTASGAGASTTVRSAEFAGTSIAYCYNTEFHIDDFNNYVTSGEKTCLRLDGTGSHRLYHVRTDDSLNGGGNLVVAASGVTVALIGVEVEGTLNNTAGGTVNYDSGCRFNATTGTITDRRHFTGGVSPVERDQAYYVNKHGSDANDGLTPDEAKLTFGSAITAAAAQTPSTSNRFVIVCDDAGIYNENITCQSWIDVRAPDAVLTGSVALADDSHVVFKRVTVSTGTAITKTSGTGISRVKVDDLEATSTAGCLLNSGTGAVVILEAKTVRVATGTAIGDVSTAAGHVHVDIEDLYISGNGGTGIARFGSGSIIGKITHILETGTPTTTTGINVAGGEIDLVVGSVSADTAYSVASGAVLRLAALSITGTRSVTGDAYVLEAGRPVLSKTITIEDPTSSEDISMFFTNLAISVQEMRAVVRGSTPSVTWTVRHGTDRSGTGAEVVTGGTTTTSQTSGSDVTTFNDATIVADSFVWVETTAQTGTVDELTITVIYTED